MLIVFNQFREKAACYDAVVLSKNLDSISTVMKCYNISSVETCVNYHEQDRGYFIAIKLTIKMDEEINMDDIEQCYYTVDVCMIADQQFNASIERELCEALNHDIIAHKLLHI